MHKHSDFWQNKGLLTIIPITTPNKGAYKLNIKVEEGAEIPPVAIEIEN